jgi:hypothetical protein
MAKLPLSLVAAGIILAGVLGAVLPGSVAAARPATTTTSAAVGPKQSFTALVNGQSAHATVKVICPGPVQRNQMGNPESGQTIAVERPSTVTAAPGGFTGTKGDSIVAELPSPSATAANTGVIFTDYGSQAIPTTILLPCDGSSTVLFVPRPTSRTARSAHVTITFLPTCDSTVCPAAASARTRI